MIPVFHKCMALMNACLLILMLVDNKNQQPLTTMNIEPKSKCLRSGPPDLRTCALCMRKLDGKKKTVKNPTVEGLKTIFISLEQRKDTT